jgi:hypothetical protein
MHYLKCADPFTMYQEPNTRLVIRRGEVAAVALLTDKMRARVRAKGLLEVSKEEYEAYLASKLPVVAKVEEKQEAIPAVAEEVKEEVVAEESASQEAVEEAIEDAPKPKFSLKRRK